MASIDDWDNLCEMRIELLNSRFERLFSMTKPRMEEFIRLGECLTEATKARRRLSPVRMPSPPFEPWELTGVQTQLYRMVNAHAALMEVCCIEKNTLDIQQENLAVKYFIYAALLDFHNLFLDGIRFPKKRILQKVSSGYVMFVALGRLIEIDIDLKYIVELYLRSCAKKRINGDLQLYDGLVFFVLADIYDLEYPSNTMLGDPFFNWAALNWKTDDLGVSKKLFTGLYEKHVIGMVLDNDPSAAREEALWHFFPVHIYLIQKEREKLGLINPVIDHSLANIVIPEGIDMNDDELVSMLNSVAEKLYEQGFSESAVKRAIG